MFLLRGSPYTWEQDRHRGTALRFLAYSPSCLSKATFPERLSPWQELPKPLTHLAERNDESKTSILLSLLIFSDLQSLFPYRTWFHPHNTCVGPTAPTALSPLTDEDTKSPEKCLCFQGYTADEPWLHPEADKHRKSSLPPSCSGQHVTSPRMKAALGEWRELRLHLTGLTTSFFSPKKLEGSAFARIHCKCEALVEHSME